MSAATTNARGSHVSRVLTIATHAFTQLVRMKVFYFLVIFVVVGIAANFFNLPQHQSVESVGVNVLRNIKGWSLGAMTLFALVMSIVATALLLPRDVEDRTLYTILAKPVPRIDYLIGKLLGVLMLVFVSLALMDLLMVGVLQFRTHLVMAEQEQIARGMGWDQEAIDSLRRDVLVCGPNWGLQAAVLSIFLKAVVMAAIALWISTFSTSTLFTTIVSTMVLFIGHFQADARDFYLSSGEAGQTTLSQWLAMLFSMVMPDFQLFNVVDGLIQGQVISLLMMGKLALVALYYAVFFLFASWWVFSDKEF